MGYNGISIVYHHQVHYQCCFFGGLISWKIKGNHGADLFFPTNSCKVCNPEANFTCDDWILANSNDNVTWWVDLLKTAETHKLLFLFEYFEPMYYNVYYMFYSFHCSVVPSIRKEYCFVLADWINMMSKIGISNLKTHIFHWRLTDVLAILIVTTYYDTHSIT